MRLARVDGDTTLDRAHPHHAILFGVGVQLGPLGRVRGYGLQRAGDLAVVFQRQEDRAGLRVGAADIGVVDAHAVMGQRSHGQQGRDGGKGQGLHGGPRVPKCDSQATRTAGGSRTRIVMR